MKHIKSIEFVLENCESFNIDANYFGTFLIDDIRYSIQRIACNSIIKMAIADTIVIELFSEGDREYRPFGGLEKATIFERLQKYNDITQIIVHYEDQTEEAYFTNWAKGNDGENKNQGVCKSDLGNLYIVISADKDFSTFFDTEYMNDKDYIDFAKDMII